MDRLHRVVHFLFFSFQKRIVVRFLDSGKVLHSIYFAVLIVSSSIRFVEERRETTVAARRFICIHWCRMQYIFESYSQHASN